MTPGLRILHVVTLVSPGGEYGGPTRVALNQSRALAAAGHRPMVAAGGGGFARMPHAIDGVPLRLFPVRRLVPGTGFAGISSPGLLRWLSAASRSCDVLHIHLARDLVTMPVALMAQRLGVPYVVQTHGMIDASPRILARVLDAVATRRVLNAASAVFHLTEGERSDLTGVAGASQSFVLLRNGIAARAYGDSGTAQDGGVEVLYLARLHPRKRPMDFVDAATSLLTEHPRATFRMVGPDEGEGDRVATAIARVGSPRLTWDGPLPMEATSGAMARAAVYVLPAVDEPYPMTVLEAMSQGVPVVVTDSCGLAPLVRSTGSGVVTAPGASAVRAAVDRLLGNAPERRRMGNAARRTAERELDMATVTTTLLAAYEEARERRSRSAA